MKIKKEYLLSKLKKYEIEEIEAQSYEILSRLKHNEIDIAITFVNELIDYIRILKKR